MENCPKWFAKRSSIVIFWLLFGCQKTITEIPAIYVQGWVHNTGLSDSSDVSLSISGTPEIPTVKINDIPLYFDGFSAGELHFSSYTFPLSPGDSVKLRILYEQSTENPKKIWVDLMLPEIVNFVQFPESLSIQDTLKVFWRTAHGAKEYKLRIAVHLFYTDTSGVYHYFDVMKTFWTKDTLIFLPPDSLFPPIDEIGGVLPSSTLGLSIMAFNGSYKEGDPANIKGDGFGYFYTRTLGDYITITIVEL